MAAVGFFGCCGAARESQCLIGTVSKRFPGPGLCREAIQSIQCLVSVMEGSLQSNIERSHGLLLANPVSLDSAP